MLNNQNPYNMNNVQFTPEGQLKASGVTFNPLIARQERLHQLDMKRIMNGGTVKRGRPVNANSERQLRLADLAARRAAGGVKRGRPVGSGKKGNTAITKTQTPGGVDVVVVG